MGECLLCKHEIVSTIYVQPLLPFIVMLTPQFEISGSQAYGKIATKAHDPQQTLTLNL